MRLQSLLAGASSTSNSQVSQPIPILLQATEHVCRCIEHPKSMTTPTIFLLHRCTQRPLTQTTPASNLLASHMSRSATSSKGVNVFIRPAADQLSVDQQICYSLHCRQAAVVIMRVSQHTNLMPAQESFECVFARAYKTDMPRRRL